MLGECHNQLDHQNGAVFGCPIADSARLYSQRRGNASVAFAETIKCSATLSLCFQLEVVVTCLEM